MTRENITSIFLHIYKCHAAIFNVISNDFQTWYNSKKVHDLIDFCVKFSIISLQSSLIRPQRDSIELLSSHDFENFRLKEAQTASSQVSNKASCRFPVKKN